MHSQFLSPFPGQTEEEHRKDPLHKAILQEWNKSVGKGRGKGRAESTIDDPTRQRIFSLLPDLQKILEVASPPFYDEEGSKKKLRDLANVLELIKPKHAIRLSLEDVTSRMDFCTKIVQKFFEDEKGKPYTLKAIRGVLQDQAFLRRGN